MSKQFWLTGNKIKILLTAALSLSFCCSNVLFAQASDDDAINALKSDLQSSWSKNDQSELADLSKADKTVSNSKSDLEEEEQALLRKLNSKTAEATKPAVKGSLSDPEDLTPAGLVSLDEDNSIPAKKEEKAKLVEADSKIEVIQDMEVNKQKQKRPVAAVVQETKVQEPKAQETKAVQQVNQVQTKRISELETRLREKNKELEETRSRLLLAETQVERLSNIIDKSNKQQLAGYLGEPPAEQNKPAQQTAKVTQAVSNISKPAAQEDSLIGVVSTAKAYLRSGPSTNDAPIMTVSRGTRLVVETRNQGWYRVITPTGSRAWISTDMLKFGPGTETGSGSSVRISGYDQKKQ